VSGPSIVVVGGQTASGKSALALRLARDLDGEIVAADSRQVYAGLTIASAGPSDDDLSQCAHHLYGAFDPATTTLTAGEFVAAADAVIEDIVGRGKVAVIVGGTGLYLRSLRLGLSPDLPRDDDLRRQLDERLRTEGLPSLVTQLRNVDAAAAARVDLRNPVRVLRALEIALLGGDAGGRDVDTLLQQPPRAQLQQAVWWRVEPEAEAAEQAIVQRVDAMFAGGLVDESAALAARLVPEHPLLSTMGTEEGLRVHRGELMVREAAAAIVTRTRQYARRQRTWFRKEPWWTPVPPSWLR
jgi:tRNA dimethylallyltransferase